MSSDQARELRQQGIAAAKAGQKDQARQLLQQSIRLEPGSEAAWLWLASVARDQRERFFCLQKILEINPNNEQAQKALQQIENAAPSTPAASSPGVIKRITQTGEAAPVASTSAQSTQEMLAQTPGVPLPEAAKVQTAAEAAEALAHEAAELPSVSVKWVKKTRGRAGERDIWVLRSYVAAGALVVLTIFCVASFVVVSNTPSLARVVFAPTATLTFTPTMSPTPTPGLTPTPSVTPRVTPLPTATLDPFVPTADVYFPEATDVYPVVLDAPLSDAISLIDSGKWEEALPTLAAARANTSTRFNPNPYYYEAVALARSGDFTAALRTLNDAEGRLSEAPNDNFAPLLDTGFAYVLLLQSQSLLAEGNEERAASLLSEAQARAQSAVDGDSRFAQAYVMLARSYALQDDTETALDTLDAGLEQPALEYDTNLIVEKARIYLQQENYAQAERQTFIALYIDPTLESAHQVQVLSALAQNEPGLAVLRTQTYLHYYPGSVEAWRLLGDARVAEGNTDLAIEAYSQALQAGQDDVTMADLLIARAGLYGAEGRHDQALDDLSEAFDLDESDAVRVLRMRAAYAAGDFIVAERDAEALEESDAVEAGELALLSGRILVDQAEADGDAPGREAVTLLETARAGADDATLGLIDEYVAKANYLNGNYQTALEAVNDALDRGETGERHYLRGLILEARRQFNDAAAEYEWVLTWSAVYPFPFADDAAERLAELP